MKNMYKAFIMFVLFILSAIAMVFGIVYTNFYFFIIGMIILAILSVYVLKNQEELKTLKDEDGAIIEDERNRHINEKSGNKTYEIMISLCVLVGIAILTLRNNYPEYLIIAYTLIAIGIISLIVNQISSFYYKRRYD